MRVWRAELYPQYPDECRLVAVEIETKYEVEAAYEAARYLTCVDTIPPVLRDGAGDHEYDAWMRGGRYAGSVVITPATDRRARETRILRLVQ